MLEWLRKMSDKPAAWEDPHPRGEHKHGRVGCHDGKRSNTGSVPRVTCSHLVVVPEIAHRSKLTVAALGQTANWCLVRVEVRLSLNFRHDVTPSRVQARKCRIDKLSGADESFCFDAFSRRVHWMKDLSYRL